MDGFKCDDCGKTWAFEKIIPSVVKYGFVNLVGDDDELIAFNCPDESCFCMVHKRFPLKGSGSFYYALSDKLDPSGLGGGGFCYFSSQPFSKASYDILNSFEVLDYLQSAGEIQKGMSPKKWGPPAKCYSSCNYHIPSVFSGNVRELIYNSIDVERLLLLEGKEKLRLFPRYMHENSLFNCVNNFISEYFASESSLIEFFVTNEEKEGENTEEILINPSTLFRMLDVPPLNPPDALFQPDEYREYAKQESYHNSLMQELTIAHKKGELHRALSIMAEEFLHGYINDYEHHKLCSETLWDFKEGYLEKLHQEWQSGSLTLKSKPDQKRPDTIVKEKCQAVAKMLHELNKNLSFEDIMSSTEIKNAAQRPFLQPGREHEIKTYTTRQLGYWLKEVLPKEMHPKPGRKSQK